MLSRHTYIQSLFVAARTQTLFLQKINCSDLNMPSRQVLLLSSSNCHGFTTLEFAKEEICSFLNKNQIKSLIFVPYAQPDFEKYTNRMKGVITPWGYDVSGLHSYPDPAMAIDAAKAIFIGGGNTFLLLKTLYEYNLVSLIKKRVLEGNLAYIGSSAGTNVATKTINTTNDMPIVYPPSFEGMGLVNFNINPHYTDKVDENHKGETRDERILEYMQMPESGPVLGLREGAVLHVDGSTLTIKGVAGAVLFKQGDPKKDFPVGADLSFLADI